MCFLWSNKWLFIKFQQYCSREQKQLFYFLSNNGPYILR